MKVGDTFSSLDELSDAIARYQSENSVNLYIRSSRSVEKYQEKLKKKVVNPDLQFAELTFWCVYGGNFKPRGTDQRPNQKSYKLKGCSAHITIGTSKDGQRLCVSKLISEHNHPVDKGSFQQHPRQRKLDDDTLQEASKMLKAGANKKKVQAMLMAKTGKIVTLRDVHNIARQEAVAAGPVSVNEVVDLLQSQPGGEVHIVESEDHSLQLLLYQDIYMKEVFQQYPEVLFVDGTYRLNQCRMPLYLFVVEDSNGHSVVVAFALLASEDQTSVQAMGRALQEANTEVLKLVKSVMSDKDQVLRSVMRECCPDAQLQLCRFHTCQTFRREVTCSKMNISANVRDRALAILQSLVYAANEDEFQAERAKLKAAAFKPIDNYLTKYWDECRDEWVHFLSPTSSLGNSTNNRIESLNQKIKQVITLRSNMRDFFSDLLLTLNSFKTERLHSAHSAADKVAVLYDLPEGCKEYYDFLTPYAANKVKAELKKKFSSSDFCAIGNSGDYSLTYHGKRIKASKDSCECWHFVQMGLPCAHIFAIRNLEKEPHFDETLCSKRWTKSTCRQSLMSTSLHPTPSLSVSMQKPPHIGSENEKFREASGMGKKIAELAAEVPMDVFRSRMKTLERLVEAWQRNADVFIVTHEDVGDGNSYIDERDQDVVSQMMADKAYYDNLDAYNSRVRDEPSEWPSNSASMDEPDLSNAPTVSPSAEIMGSALTDEPEVSSSIQQADAVIDGDTAVLPPAEIMGSALTEDEPEISSSIQQADQVNNDGDPLSELQVIEVNSEVMENLELVELNGEKLDLDFRETQAFDVSILKFPPSRIPRGRPKGSETTSIGLPRKRAKNGSKKSSCGKEKKPRREQDPPQQ